MTEQELNKKLAEWVGFVESFAGKKMSPHGQYKAPEYCKWHYPYFTQSLDACFEWLVPKLNQLGWGVNLMQAMNNSYWKCVLWEWGNPFTTPLDHKREDADTPALALCKAIEKLIDAEAK